MVLRPRTPHAPRARALLPATRCRSSGPLGVLLSPPALDVRLPTPLQVLQVRYSGPRAPSRSPPACRPPPSTLGARCQGHEQQHNNTNKATGRARTVGSHFKVPLHATCQFRRANPARPLGARTPGKAQVWPRASAGNKRSPEPWSPCMSLPPKVAFKCPERPSQWCPAGAITEL